MKKYHNTQDFSTLPPCVTTTFVNMNTLKWTCYIFTFSNMKNSYEDHANTHNDMFVIIPCHRKINYYIFSIVIAFSLGSVDK